MFSIAYFQQHGHAPGLEDLIELYYGEPVEKVSFFIGFEKFWAFDMPLISTGSEDLYFTVTPSLYMTQAQFRTVLYDHLFARRVEEPDYESLPGEAIERMRAFYQANRGSTLGVGFVRDQFWYPLPQLEIPKDFQILTPGPHER